MHYFKFNNPDWHLSTGHLSAEEEGIYLRLIRHYYDTEKPIPLETESVFRRLRLSDLSEKALLILEEFFVETEKGFTHTYCNKIIAEYHKKAKTNKINGKNGGRPSNGKASSVSHKKPSGLSVGTHEEPSRNPNQEPLTINQEPLTIINTPIPPRGRKPAIEIQTFIDQCKAEGVKTLSPDDPVFEYAKEAGIPDNFLRLAWVEFKDKSQANNKRQSDWRKTFRNYIRGNYLKLWYLAEDNTHQLTTVGRQAEIRHGSKL